MHNRKSGMGTVTEMGLVDLDLGIWARDITMATTDIQGP